MGLAGGKEVEKTGGHPPPPKVEGDVGRRDVGRSTGIERAGDEIDIKGIETVFREAHRKAKAKKPAEDPARRLEVALRANPSALMWLPEGIGPTHEWKDGVTSSLGPTLRYGYKRVADDVYGQVNRFAAQQKISPQEAFNYMRARGTYLKHVQDNGSVNLNSYGDVKRFEAYDTKGLPSGKITLVLAKDDASAAELKKLGFAGLTFENSDPNNGMPQGTFTAYLPPEPSTLFVLRTGREGMAFSFEDLSQGRAVTGD